MKEDQFISELSDEYEGRGETKEKFKIGMQRRPRSFVPFGIGGGVFILALLSIGFTYILKKSKINREIRENRGVVVKFN